MKNIISFFLVITPFIIYSQKYNKRDVIEYANMSSISITNNTENYFSNYGANEEKNNGISVGFDINTIQGVKFFELVSISAGISVDWNINKTFLSTPCFIDLRLFSNRNNQDGLFLYIQTGKNIKWSNSFDGNGVTAKLGIGVVIKNSEKTSFYVDVFHKSKQIETEEFNEKSYYNVNGYGISLGLSFN
jgi:hypothetical protein